MTMKTSINELKLPSPRLMHIEFESVRPIINPRRYENEELRNILPGLF